MTRLRRLAVGGTVVLLAVGCSQADSPSWVEQARVASPPSDLDGLDAELGPDSNPALGVIGCGELGIDPPRAPEGDAGGDRPPAGDTLDRGEGNDPYLATGARQVPGADMVLVGPPDAPVAIVVARPHDPDEHVAARNPDREVTGPVPAPRVYLPSGRVDGPPGTGEATPEPDADQADVPVRTPGACDGVPEL